MPFNRSGILLARCLRKISAAGLTAKSEDVYDSMTIVQKNLAMDYFALPRETTLILEAGKDKYDLAGKIYKLRTIEFPSSWNYKVNIVLTPDQFINAKETVFNSQPTVMLVYDQYLKMHYPPSTSGEKLTVYFFTLPQNAITEDDEPEIDSNWDDALVYGNMVEMNIPGDDFLGKFISTARARMNNTLRSTMQPIIPDHFTDGIGF